MTRGKKLSLFLISFLALSLFCFQITKCHAEKYAVLISTSEVMQDDKELHSEYWYDLFLIYETLINQGYTHENIYVLYGEGEDFISNHLRYRVSNTQWSIDHITDDNNHIKTIRNFFSWFKVSKMTSEDDLFFWWMGHGSYDANTGLATYLINNPRTGYVGIPTINENDIQGFLDGNYRTRCLFFPVCYSGCIVDELINDRTIVLTSTPCGPTDAVSQSLTILKDVVHNDFNYYLYSALNGVTPKGKSIHSGMNIHKCGQILWGLNESLLDVYHYIQPNTPRVAQLSNRELLSPGYTIFNLHSDSFFKVDKTHTTFPSNEANVFENIQDAIDNANDNNKVILVAEGTYNENITITNKDIILIGINGETETTINGGNSGSVITINGNAQNDVQIAGFTITDGNAPSNDGGGIHCNGATLTICGCTIKGNHAQNGGGISVTASSSFFDNCTITDNTATDGQGGGFYYNSGDSNIEMTNCVIVDNSASQGSGLYISNADKGTFMNCTIAGNDVASGYAVYINSPSDNFEFTNCILWNDPDHEIMCNDCSHNEPEIMYSNITDTEYDGAAIDYVNWPFEKFTNIHEDPLFVNPSANDYHLQAESPCINKGDDPSEIIGDRDGFLRPIGKTYDMGAYEVIKTEFFRGDNLFIPAHDCENYDSYDLMYELGQDYVTSISWYWDPINQEVKTTYMLYGHPYGDRFPISTGNLYSVRMTQYKAVYSPCLANIYSFALSEISNSREKAEAIEAIDSASYLGENTKRALYRKIDELFPDPIDEQSSEMTSSIESYLPEEIWQQRITAGMFGRLSKVNVYVSSPGTAKFFVNLGAPWQTDSHDFETTVTIGEVGWISIDTYSANINLHPGDQYVIGFQGAMGQPQTPWANNENGTLSTNLYFNYTMGYRFTPVKDGLITKLGGYFNGTRTVSLWDPSGTKLTSATVTSSNNWSYTDITPVYVTAGQTYTVAVYLAGYGGSRRNNVQPFPKTYGDIIIESSCYNYGDQYPVVDESSYMFGQADILFEPIKSLGISRSDSSAYNGGELWSGPSSPHPDYDLAFQTYIMPGESTIQTPWMDNENGTLYTNLSYYYTMGYRFTPVKDGCITRLGGYFNGTRTVSLWDPSGTKLTSATVTSSNNWSYTDITPVNVTAGQTYTVAAYLAGYGGSRRNLVQPFPSTYGDITIQSSCYSYGDNYPLFDASSYMYGQVDIGFVVSPLQPWKDHQNGTLYTNQELDKTLGYDFIPSVDGTITMIGGLFNGAKKVTIWDSYRNKLLVTTVTSNNSWSYVDIMPLTVNAGEKYTVAVYAAGSGASYRTGIEELPRQYEAIKIACSRYDSGDTFPTYEHTSTMYGQVDIGFLPSYPWIAPPVAEWYFDEGSGNTVFDESGNGNDGTIIGATWTEGKIGNGLSFDGQNDYVNVPSLPSMRVNEVSVSAWVNFSGNRRYACIVDKGCNNYENFYLYCGAWNTQVNFAICFTDGSKHGSGYAPSVSLGEWHHYVGTWDGSHIKLYLDGELVSTSVDYSGLIMQDTAHSLTIGKRNWPAPPYYEHFWGKIDEVLIYDKALGAEEIETLASIASYRFGEGQGTTTVDDSGNGHDGTIYGATWTDGKIGNGLSFDGQNDYVNVPSLPSMGTNAVSVEAWVNFSGNRRYACIVDKGRNDNANFYMLCGNWNTQVNFALCFTDGTKHSAGLSPSVSLGEWHHYVGTWDGSHIKLYLDGELVSTSDDYSGLIMQDTAHSLTIGKRNWPAPPYYEHFWGKIDEVHIYDKALSAEEVENRYSQGSS